jgi:phosphate uptake regulator
LKYYGFISKHASRRADTVDARKLGHHIYHQFEEDSALLLARRQPVASDLRLLISIIKTITDLERMGAKRYE